MASTEQFSEQSLSRDFSLFLPFILGLTAGITDERAGFDQAPLRHGLILIDPVTQTMMVIEGDLDPMLQIAKRRSSADVESFDPGLGERGDRGGRIKYYNGCLFHTVKKDFTAQTGDPTGTGSGGDSIYKFLYGDQARFFGNEIHLDLKHSKRGTVAMASAGEDLNASQFYITLRDDLDYLDGTDTVFGEVAEGLETLDRINEAFVDDNSRPLKNIRIKHTYVLDDPFDDPPQLAELVPDASPEGKPKDEVDDVVRLEDDWVPMDEQLAPDEVEEVLRAQKAKSSALVLESIGDIPDAEIKPPDNVLFVCKLNPVTEDGDLHTIFSRFGTVTSAEIIRDFKTGDSLCYAFIEFEDKEACEQAYFKMDNALIDDRRIHVDFSQSVAKLWSQYRRKNTQKGGGCFKCGSPDHLARDCTGSPNAKQQPAKYILKDDTRNGGDDNSRYQMVFDEDMGGSPDRSKRRRRNELYDHSEKRSTNREGLDELKGREDRNRDSGNRQREYDRSKEYKEYRRDDRHRSHRKSPSEGPRKDYSRRDDHDISRSTVGDRYAGRRDDRDHRRSTDSSSHRDRADDGRHDNKDESHSIKLRVDDDGRRSRGERAHVKSNRNSDHDRDHVDDGSHDNRDESHRTKAHLDDDGHRSRGERDHARSSTKSDSGRHRDRERRH